MCCMCSKFIIETLKPRDLASKRVLTVNFEHIRHIKILVLLQYGGIIFIVCIVKLIFIPGSSISIHIFSIIKSFSRFNKFYN